MPVCRPIAMKLHLTQAAGQQLITGYGADWIEVNRIRFSHSLLVQPAQVHEDWQTMDFNSLSSADFERIAALKPELVLLGTGAQHRFIHPKLTQSLTAVGISVECMATPAACRTYNILMAEGRDVVAALLLS